MKLAGFEEQPQQSHSIRHLEVFLSCIADPDDDGRVLVISNSPTEFTFKYLLLNPSKKFLPLLLESKSVIFAGGTMSPLEDFLIQLLPTIPKESIDVFRCGHVIPSNQLCAILCTTGIGGSDLEFSYAKRQDPTLMNEAGHAIVNFATIIPGGVVVFFPSYSYLADIMENWKQSQIISRLAKRKPIFVESRTAGAGILTNYSDAVKRHGSAILFAVVGGSLSEGINFSDDLGRAVIVVGIPFANVKSPELAERMKYLDKQGMGITGSEYYENICMKAVNQCIGRAIRHKYDYATVILMDKRYESVRLKSKLTEWILDIGLHVPNSFGKSLGLISKVSINNIVFPRFTEVITYSLRIRCLQ